jgi:type IV pilus assembly protein PilC
MPWFRYTAIDSMGRPYAGTLEADNLETVRTKLTELHYHIVGISEVPAPSNINDFFKNFTRIKMKELVAFSRQFATMIDAGLSVLKCLDILQKQTSDQLLRDTLAAVRKDVHGGASLTEALAKHPRVFTRLYVNMVRAAETGGILDQVLDRLAGFLEKEMEMAQKVKSAMMYPTIVFVIAFGVMNYMMFVVLPSFKRIFDDMGLTKLPLTTTIMLGLAMYTKKYWYLVLGGIVGLVVAIILYGRTETGALHLDRIKLRIPILGDLTLKVSISRFARTFGTLISAGVPVLRALEITADTAGNRAVAQVIEQACASVKEGEKISDPMQSSAIFPLMVTQMIAIGEETGRLDQMLIKVSDFYDAEVDATLKGLASLIEPLMIAFVGIMVGFIAVSVIAPIYSLVGSIK